MKRLFVLLLALCMVFSLAACKSKDAENSGDAANAGENNGGEYNDTEWTYEHVVNTGNFNKEELITGTNVAATNTEILSNDDLINPDAFAGKSIQIYGYDSAVYEDIDAMGQGSFIWMVRAAIAEWAALNKVNVEFVGGFDENVIQGDINSGGNPDLLIYCNKFPMPAVNGLLRPFTQEEYNQLAKTCGSYYLDMMSYKGQSYGVQSPWSGGTLFYYNKTLFDQYGVKSPAEYFMEGNWNWETFEKCINEITKDTNGDGKNDIYGSGTVQRLIPNPLLRTRDANGKLTCLLDSQVYRDFLGIAYRTSTETKSWDKYADCTIATSPRPATHMGDAEWYNFEHLNQTLVNGDLIEVVPIPDYTGDKDTYYWHTMVYSSILTSCDEPEATLSLLNYVLRVGMRYMSDFSLGLYKCNYEGIRGASKYSYGWKQNFEQIVADRKAKFDELEDWNQELYEKLQYEVLNATHHFSAQIYPGQVGNVCSDTEVRTMPPASSLPLIIAREEAWINEYNNLYAK